MHERVDAARSSWNVKKKKKKKIRFAQHCVLIADEGNPLLQTVAPPNQGGAGCLSPGCCLPPLPPMAGSWFCFRNDQF